MKKNVVAFVFLFLVVTMMATAGVIAAGDDGASITVEDQTLGTDGTVTVAEANVTTGKGYVVIHLDASGNPGDIIGNKSINNGTSTNFNVTVNTTALSGDWVILWAMLHNNTNLGTTVFNGTEDTPLKNSTNHIYQASFNVTLPASPTENGVFGFGLIPAFLALAGFATIVAIRSKRR